MPSQCIRRVGSGWRKNVEVMIFLMGAKKIKHGLCSQQVVGTLSLMVVPKAAVSIRILILFVEGESESYRQLRAWEGFMRVVRIRRRRLRHNANPPHVTS